MAIETLKQKQFIQTIGIITDPDTLYIIPSFQRPYAWGSKQIDDLKHDMAKAAAHNAYHYFSAFHLIILRIGDPTHRIHEFVKHARPLIKPNLDGEDGNYALKSTSMKPVNLYAVVDGQQRLTTLFILANLYIYSINGDRSLLYIKDNGHLIPKLIQNPLHDHLFMMNIVEHIWDSTNPIGSPQTMAQKRMLENYNKMREWDQTTVEFLGSENFETTAIELEPDYGLTSFTTLNDRGKDLTILEKLKTLFLQFTDDATQVTPTILEAKPLIVRIQEIFGALYQTLDACIYVKLFKDSEADDDMVKLISCYIRLDQDADAIWQSASKAYEDYFRTKLSNPTTLNDAVTLIAGWCNRIEELRQQLTTLNSYLDLHGTTVIATGSSLYFPQTTSSLRDDYRATILSLRLQPHFLALLLKFRHLFKLEWHERVSFAVNTSSLQPALTIINDTLNKIQNRATAEPVPPPLLDYINGLLHRAIQPKPAISVLEVVERIQLAWNTNVTAPAGFIGLCRATFNMQSPDATAFLSRWVYWWHGPESFPKRLVNKTINEYIDANVRFILREHERSKGNNLHFPPFLPHIATGDIELEHVFAQNMDTQLAATVDIKNGEDMNRFINRIGNMTWLPSQCNVHLGNQDPFIKAAEYCNCLGHPNGSTHNISSNIHITKELGQGLQALGTHSMAMRLYIEARSAELALFALERFC